VNGGFIALAQCVKTLLAKKIINKNPIIENVGAISIGIVDGSVMLDLAYNEDSKASADMNIVMTETGRIVEIQGTAERQPFSFEEFNKMFNTAQTEIKKIIKLQKEFLK
jgi:ribonuclease PH